MKRFISDFKMNSTLFVALSVIYMEIILKLFTCDVFFDAGLIIMPLFSAIPALLLSCVCTKLKARAGKCVTACVLVLLLILYAAQVVYHGFFGTYFIFYSLVAGGAGQIAGEGMLGSTLQAIVSAIPAILLLAVPVVLYIIFSPKHIKYRQIRWSHVFLGLASVVCLHTAVVLCISMTGSLSRLQSGEFNPGLAVGKFGLLRTEVLDIKYNIIGVKQKIDLENEKPLYVDTSVPPSRGDGDDKPEPPSPNIMDIDFAALNATETDKSLITLNNYFASKDPTLKNEYTGMYEGYNLITITAEGFSPYAIDPELTPTLYKMYQEGFKFTNFYTPIWEVSTSDGEYAACTGLIPKSGVWSFYRSGSNYMPFCLGNMFQSIGVDKTFAYHNHTYDYYHRDVSHPNMGYDYKGYGSGVEKYVTKRWPESDVELIAGSVKEYLSDDKPFHAYYMTVSGHLLYSFSGNTIARKNRDLVSHLDCSDLLKAYYACNIELDRAMENLLEELNKAGVADKTVIAITPDHYPYGLETDTDKYSVWRELLGHDVDTTFELYESCFLLYCQGTKDAPTVDKYCSSIDILPTILNLFGFEYDSRLLMGTDIFSSSECIVQFLDRSFITSMGKYDANTKEFTLHEGKSFDSAEAEAEYIKNATNIVNNRFKISTGILDTDYYSYVFGKK